MSAHQQDPERWQSGRMHRIRNPAYRFTCTEGSNPSLSAKQFNEYASHEAFLFCIHTSTPGLFPAGYADSVDLELDLIGKEGCIGMES